MEQCAWCGTNETRKTWRRARINHNDTVCNACYRSVRNNYVTCHNCEKRKFCVVIDHQSVCSSCNTLTKRKLVDPWCCVKCHTTKSMNWHTTENGDPVCLFCYDENALDNGPIKQERKKRRYSRRITQYRLDDVEAAAQLFYQLILTLNK